MAYSVSLSAIKVWPDATKTYYVDWSPNWNTSTTVTEHCQNYEVVWQYTLGGQGDKWFTGSKTTEEYVKPSDAPPGFTHTSQFTLPEFPVIAACEVRVYVKPISNTQTKTDDKGKETTTTYFTGQWASRSITITTPGFTPPTAPTPVIEQVSERELKRGDITASVTLSSEHIVGYGLTTYVEIILERIVTPQEVSQSGHYNWSKSSGLITVTNILYSMPTFTFRNTPYGRYKLYAILYWGKNNFGPISDPTETYTTVPWSPTIPLTLKAEDEESVSITFPPMTGMATNDETSIMAQYLTGGGARVLKDIEAEYFNALRKNLKTLYATSYDIQYVKDEPDFTPIDVPTQTGIAQQHVTITGLESGAEYFFRYRAVNDTGHTFWSDEVFSHPANGIFSIIISTKPAIPTTWSSGTTVARGEYLYLYWVHNTSDLSSEKRADIELSIQDSIDPDAYNTVNLFVNNNRDKDHKDDTSYIKIDTSTMTIVEAAGDDSVIVNGTEYSLPYTIWPGIDFSEYTGKLDWRVRTKGIGDDYSEWSIKRTVKVYTQPTLTLGLSGELVDNDDPITTFSEFPIRVRYYLEPITQWPVSYDLEIVSNESYDTYDELGRGYYVSQGQVIYSVHYNVTTDSAISYIDLTAGDVNLMSGVTYTARGTVATNIGLITSATCDFKMEYTESVYTPNAMLTLSTSDYSMQITPYCIDDDGDYVDNIELSVYRHDMDGTFIEIESGLDNLSGITITDPHPNLNYVMYRITATNTETSNMSYYDIPAYPVGCNSVILQWDESWYSFETYNDDPLTAPSRVGPMLFLPYNLDTNFMARNDVELVKYSGRRNPVSYYGTQKDESFSISTQIDKKDTDTITLLRHLQKWSGDVYVREPTGVGYWASVEVQLSVKHIEPAADVSVTVTRVEGGI